MNALVSSGRIDDDRHMDELHVCRRAEQEFAVVIVRAAASVVPAERLWPKARAAA